MLNHKMINHKMIIIDALCACLISSCIDGCIYDVSEPYVYMYYTHLGTPCICENKCMCKYAVDAHGCVIVCTRILCRHALNSAFQYLYQVWYHMRFTRKASRRLLTLRVCVRCRP